MALKKICDGRAGASGDRSHCGGREGRVSGPDKEDDGADEARGRDARLLVRRHG